MRRFSILVSAGLALAGFAVGVQQSAAATTPPTTLYAGHSLTALTANNYLQSSNSEFQLNLSPDFVAINEFALLTGPQGNDSNETGIWFRDDGLGQYQSNTDHSTLKMQTDGNLVLRTAGGHVLWASNTPGTGSSDYVTMQTDGNLVIYTPDRKVVWASHSTAIFLTPGQRLNPGKIMSDRWGDQQGPVHRIYTLKMQTDGNVVYRCNSTVKWASNTHVAGSYLSMQTDGNLVIRSPKGAALWATNTQKIGPYSWFDGSEVAVYQLYDFTPKWQAHIPYSTTC